MSRTQFCVFLLAAAMVGFAGCGETTEPADWLERVPATVNVTYKDAPVEGAFVTLYPESGGGKSAQCRTDSKGKGVLGTYEAADGAVPGSYKVTVVKQEGGDVVEGAEESDAADEGEEGDEGDEEDAADSSTGKSALPEKYSSVATTDLTATISEGGGDNVVLTLSD